MSGTEIILFSLTVPLLIIFIVASGAISAIVSVSLSRRTRFSILRISLPPGSLFEWNPTPIVKIPSLPSPRISTTFNARGVGIWSITVPLFIA